MQTSVVHTWRLEKCKDSLLLIINKFRVITFSCQVFSANSNTLPCM